MGFYPSPEGKFAVLLRIVTVLAVALVSSGCARRPEPPAEPLVIGTTTSLADSGLLQHLAASFERDSGIPLRWHSVGSGRALKMAESGEVPLAITHDPDAERRVAASGRVALQRPVMRNDFVIVGPDENPAGLRAGETAVEALRKIASSRVKFCSRGDGSGTHARETRLWKAARVEPRDSPGYVVMGQPMGALLRSADEMSAYALTDRATFESMAGALDLSILCEGDPALENVYVVTVMKDRHSQQSAMRFAEWLASRDGRRAIDSFRPNGRPLFQAVP